ncbi:CBS domain-containing protein [Arenibacter certesii]|uniref:CBS domain-containing protein n=1 Tax=Arenibacter certesii TaxID=228955 RepID=A0A918MNK7_9FLAO|nr:CBS domain-containing protein [Arenibacter certesii]GGW40112.1 hypothetical protein GCM10007383_26090 [Arenibacter certesii]
MQIQDSILTTVPVFKVTDSLKEVIQYFNQTAYSHVAVEDDGLYIGMLEKNDVDNYGADKIIEEYRCQLATFFARPEASWLDVLELFSKNEANVLPIVNNEGKVVGHYDLIDVVNLFIDTPFFTEPGGILVLAKGIKDYSFSEIAQIVESNNLKLIGAFITDSRNDVIQITIKIGATHLNEVIQSFRRYNYTILYGNDDDQFLEDLKERSDYLDKYLNV